MESERPDRDGPPRPAPHPRPRRPLPHHPGSKLERDRRPPSTGPGALFGFTFYMLTGLHAAHVLGGLIALAVVTARAHRGAYSAADHAGIELCARYWHFLDIVWIVLFAVLLVGNG
ncbi:MAG: cytochrome c oxidase subunit 3 [Candidatus Eisenbacteria bacterium]